MQAISSPAFHPEIHISFLSAGASGVSMSAGLLQQMLFFYYVRLEHRVNFRHLKFAFSVLYK